MVVGTQVVLNKGLLHVDEVEVIFMWWKIVLKKKKKNEEEKEGEKKLLHAITAFFFRWVYLDNCEIVFPLELHLHRRKTIQRC